MKKGEKDGINLSRRFYQRISNHSRRRLIEMVYKEYKGIHEAANLLEMNYSTAKTIMRTFRREKRAMKKNAKQKKEDNGILITKDPIQKMSPNNYNSVTSEEVFTLMHSISCENFEKSIISLN
jgi:hypothetical protein